MINTILFAALILIGIIIVLYTISLFSARLRCSCGSDAFVEKTSSDIFGNKIIEYRCKCCNKQL